MDSSASYPTRLLVAAGLAWIEGRVLVQRRPPRARWGAGLWEFPGGQVEPGEGPSQALARELVEEWGPRAALLHPGRIAAVCHHVYPAPGPEVVLLVYHVNAGALADWPGGWASAIEPAPGAEIRALAPNELHHIEFLAADAPIVEDLRTHAISNPF